MHAHAATTARSWASVLAFDAARSTPEPGEGDGAPPTRRSCRRRRIPVTCSRERPRVMPSRSVHAENPARSRRLVGRLRGASHGALTRGHNLSHDRLLDSRMAPNPGNGPLEARRPPGFAWSAASGLRRGRPDDGPCGGAVGEGSRRSFTEDSIPDGLSPKSSGLTWHGPRSAGAWVCPRNARVGPEQAPTSEETVSIRVTVS